MRGAAYCAQAVVIPDTTSTSCLCLELLDGVVELTHAISGQKLSMS